MRRKGINELKSGWLQLKKPEQLSDDVIERKRVATLCRRAVVLLNKDKPLAGDELEIALSSVRGDDIVKKLKNGEPLNVRQKRGLMQVLKLRSQVA